MNANKKNEIAGNVIATIKGDFDAIEEALERLAEKFADEFEKELGKLELSKGEMDDRQMGAWDDCTDAVEGGATEILSKLRKAVIDSLKGCK